ncbi:hypothetical protein SPBR_09141 [Sporothrix brasiliensis 5110]|uniref:Uncharacterized protein n=1 Tax=Sporothrix brasiliensis 5110 TaxID=1398154 RepID=A0A0C2F0K3_9PEZI|nr:uncharacterized protein SPBR_09141 [Sporothrix brasiliensis 5110]KIH92319.1 hypothetical protein SPBR_09141 [Sporothrix brasiliensis 5110]
MAVDDFTPFPEDQDDDDPPPAYSNIGPGPVPFRDCVNEDAGHSRATTHGHSQGHNQNQNHQNHQNHQNRTVVRDTQRRQSFGIGGAGNIRMISKESGVAVVPDAPLLLQTSPAVEPTAFHEPGPHTHKRDQRRASASGANDLRDRLVDGVKSILSKMSDTL